MYGVRCTAAEVSVSECDLIGAAVVYSAVKFILQKKTSPSLHGVTHLNLKTPPVTHSSATFAVF